jgi:transcriptional regulator of aromatic amino acid metabolism
MALSLISQTATFSDLFSKINELVLEVNSLRTNQGDLPSLNSLNKTNLVSSINEKFPSLALSILLEE